MHKRFHIPAQLSLICLLISVPLLLHAKIFEVSVGGKLNSITHAIAQAKSGDTILVNEGNYKEQNIVIDKPLVLLGRGTPGLDGESKYEIISIKASRVVIDGFRFSHSGYSDMVELSAIKIYQQRNVIIRNCFFYSDYFGVYSQNSAACTITNNKIESHFTNELKAGNGIHCWHCDSMNIEGNTISGQRDGIYFEFVTNSIIRKNVSKHNVRYGLHFMFSHSNLFDQNIFSENGAGVAVMYSHDVKMFDNEFSGNWGAAAYGILMKELTNCTIAYNRFSKNTTALHLEGASRCHFIHNEFSSNGWAIKIFGDCSNDTIEENNFSLNTFDVATNSSVSENYFNHNYWDKYRGYDLNRDNIGDVPFHPVSLYSKLVETVPNTVLLLHSFFVDLLDQAEKILPSITPEQFRDDSPLMKSHDLAAN